MKKITVLLSLALLASCSSDDKAGATQKEKIITFNDFESVVGWDDNVGTIDKGRAHSGKYAIKVDKDHEFSLTFDMALGEATPSKLKALHLKAWAFLPSEAAAGILGIQILEPGTNVKQVYGDGIKLGEVVKSYNKWVEVEKDFILPDNITADQHVRLSLWRAGASEQVLIDDVELSIKE